MTFPLYMALTATEFVSAEKLPEHPAWMACHFSSYGTGLSNCPRQLPEGAMLIINDRTPVRGHDAGLILEQLTQLIEAFSLKNILLDFQRPDSPETAAIAKALANGLPCPVGITEPYADALDCPVLLTPSLHAPLTSVLKRWQGRELWLEAALDAEKIILTPDGSCITPLPGFETEALCHQESVLHCHYRIAVAPQQAEFTLFRTPEDLMDLLKESNALGVTCAVGLYQELKNL